jgi:hypothetical protein
VKNHQIPGWLYETVAKILWKRGPGGSSAGFQPVETPPPSPKRLFATVSNYAIILPLKRIGFQNRNFGGFFLGKGVLKRFWAAVVQTAE